MVESDSDGTHEIVTELQRLEGFQMNTDVAVNTDSHMLQCMEIWGGNERIEQAIAVAGVNAWVYSRPYQGESQGGDIHYVSMCGGAKISRFVVADVSGHGLEAGPVAKRLRSLMKKYINTVDQARFARALNSEFSALASGGTFATAVLATYFAPTDHLVICNAGHPPPLWYQASRGTWQFLQSEMNETVDRMSNLPLGIIEPTSYAQFAVPLEKDDLVILYTDSLIECTNADDEQLGDEGLLRMVEAIDAKQPQHVQRRLLGAVEAYNNSDDSQDDVTVVVLHHNAASPPRQSVGQMIKTIGKMVGVLKV